MTLSASLLAELACVMPVADTIRPMLREPVAVVAEVILDEKDPPRLKRKRTCKCAPSTPHVHARPSRDLVVAIVTANPGCTSYDITMRLRAMGHRRTSRDATNRLLLRLARAGVLRCTSLRSRRDIQRAGGQHTWAAV